MSAVLLIRCGPVPHRNAANWAARWADGNGYDKLATTGHDVQMGASLLPWMVANAAAALINAAVLGFLARREHNHALGWWSLAWFCASVTVAISSLVEPVAPNVWQVLLVATVNITAVSAFLKGAYEVAGRPMTRRWGPIIALVATSSVLLGHFVGLSAAVAPLVLLYCVGISVTGVLVWRATPNSYGARIVCVALILIAIHVLDYPLVVDFPLLAPWGYLLMVLLETIAALGMLMLHYELARDQWRASERTLNAVRRTEALGRVAGGVAHDFNNVLTVIQGHLDLLDIDDPESVRTSSEDIGAAVGQATRLTAQLLAFGRRTVLQPQAVDIREVVRTTIDLLGRLVPEHITLCFSSDRDEYPASADRSLLEQIVLNLVSNARDALAADGGRIDVELRQVEVPRVGVQLRVVDDGPGISEAVLEHLFEPFFTTKAVGHGTGLGLASVEGAVAQLGGTIRVHSKLGEGTTFEIFLPQLATRMPRKSESRQSARRCGRVLVVDDDARVRDVAERILVRHGHTVACAADGVAALALCREQSFDVVLTDVVMPHMGGVALAAALKADYPTVRVIFTSGYPADDSRALTGVAFLPKPFNQASLLEYVSQALSLEGPPGPRESQRA